MDLKETTDKVIKYKLKYSAQELEDKLDKVDQEYSLEEKEKLNGLKNYDDSQIKSDVNTLTENKLDKNQGTENSGKVLGTNANGEIIPLNGYGFEYDEETKMLKYGTDPTSNLNQGIGLDDTLSKRGYAADAGAVGELKDDLDTLNQGGLNLKEDFIGQQVNEWLDEHPEATTTVQDGAITLDKLNSETKSFIDAKVLDDEFVSLGGVYDSVSLEQKNINSSILRELLTKYNSLCFRNKVNVQVNNFSYMLKGSERIENLQLVCIGDVESVFYVNGTANYIYINNVSITNSGSIKYGFNLGNGENTYAPYSTFEHLTLSGFTYPFVLFGWNCSIGRIQCYNCGFGVILMGTSIFAQALYANKCGHGHSFGCYPTEDYVRNINTYLTYSNIGISSVDTITDCKCAVAFGEVKFCNFNVIAYESSVIEDVIRIYGPNNSNVNIGTIQANGYPKNAFAKKISDSDTYKVYANCMNIFGDYLSKAYPKSNGISMVLMYHGTSYTETAPFVSHVEVIPTVKDGEPKRAPIQFSSDKFVSGGGSQIGTELNSFISHGKFIGILTKGKSIRIKLRGARTHGASSSIPNRQILLLANFSIGNADAYNSDMICGSTVINAYADIYIKSTDGGTGGVTLHQSNPIDGINVSVDANGDYPVIVIEPTYTGNRHNYIYSLEVNGGAWTEVSVN